MSNRLRPLITGDEPFLWEMLYQAIYVPIEKAGHLSHTERPNWVNPLMLKFLKS